MRVLPDNAGNHLAATGDVTFETARLRGSVCISLLYGNMCTITMSDCGMDIPESHCDNCDMRFNLCWNRNPVYDKPEHCPFCGDEIEEVIDETGNDE